jgi:hypothetical protein
MVSEIQTAGNVGIARIAGETQIAQSQAYAQAQMAASRNNLIGGLAGMAIKGGLAVFSGGASLPFTGIT